MDANKSCTADFDIPTLTVSHLGAGSGSVASVPVGINCGADCTEDYANGTVVTLTATPVTWSTFTAWSGGGCNGLNKTKRRYF